MEKFDVTYSYKNCIYNATVKYSRQRFEVSRKNEKELTLLPGSNDDAGNNWVGSDDSTLSVIIGETIEMVLL